ncbi:hypothetical protein [Corynebacterium sp. HMSC034H07]|uniref:hypothetical protein n=1 Tax=Corynebacterium sp. HMSC034H07 TaxID=1739512 RepID=UPI000B2AF38C|nr:hypothetical protein [Corynebacterium sp. HMSC034H07]
MKLIQQDLGHSEAETILSALPVPRRNTYLHLAKQHGGTDTDIDILAAYLYVWNGFMASVVDRTTGEVSVLLRNFIDSRFREWNSSPPRNGSPNWLEHPEAPLTQLALPEGRSRLADLAHCDSAFSPPSHDDYVAGLTFGIWVHLLPKPHAGNKNPRVVLWNEALEPHVHKLNRVEFQQYAMLVKDMRNRATHRRPLIKDIPKLEKTHQFSIELAKAINPKMGVWMRSERWIPEALKQFPAK